MKTGTEVWSYDPALEVGGDRAGWVGYDVHATDGDVGKIDGMTTETGRGCVVVDTGFWIFGKKRMIPAAAVRGVDHGARAVHVSLTKDQIKGAPDYEPGHARDTRSQDDYGMYYGRWL